MIRKKIQSLLGKYAQGERVFKSAARYGSNPIIRPDTSMMWKSWQTFNPAAVLLEGKVHLLYRAIGNDGVSRFGYANSSDGFHIDEESEESVYREVNETSVYTVHSLHSGGSFAGCEDPRLVHIEEDGRIYLTYTSCSDGLRMAISSIRVEDFLAKRWSAWTPAQYMSPPGEVHKNWVLFPEKIHGKYAICHSLSPLSIAYLDTLDFSGGAYIQSTFTPSEPSERWDSYMRGAGPPPVRVDDGWLLFYHAMNHKDMSRYKIGAMVLDYNDPSKILYRSDKPIIAPSDFYELEGYKGGVVYASGLVIKDGMLLLYYGGADSFVCLAHADLHKFLRELRDGHLIRFSWRRLVAKLLNRFGRRV